MTSFPDYKSAQEHQLKEWVEGRPWHNPWSPVAPQPFPDNRAEGECCPDFSCCYPDMFTKDNNERWRRYRERYAATGGKA